MARFDQQFRPPSVTEPPSDSLDKLAVIIALMVIWRLLGGC